VVAITRSTIRPCWCYKLALAGNAVMLKLAITTPPTALELAACFVDIGLPEGMLSVLTGPAAPWATRWSPTGACANLLHRLQ
jgi:hypothetical protein